MSECEHALRFSDFSVFGTGNMGLQRRKIATPLKTDIRPGPSKKHFEIFLPKFFQRFGQGQLFLSRTNFSNLFDSLANGLWPKLLLSLGYAKIGLSRRHKLRQKYVIATSKTAPGAFGKPFLQCPTCRRSFSGSRYIARIAPRNRFIGFCASSRVLIDSALALQVLFDLRKCRSPRAWPRFYPLSIFYLTSSNPCRPSSMCYLTSDNPCRPSTKTKTKRLLNVSHVSKPFLAIVSRTSTLAFCDWSWRMEYTVKVKLINRRFIISLAMFNPCSTNAICLTNNIEETPWALYEQQCLYLMCRSRSLREMRKWFWGELVVHSICLSRWNCLWQLVNKYTIRLMLVLQRWMRMVTFSCKPPQWFLPWSNKNFLRFNLWST